MKHYAVAEIDITDTDGGRSRRDENDHVFKKRHKIMVQIQSSWFPVIDRNPQRFVTNIFQAKESDFQRATQRVFYSGLYPSHIAVPVVELPRK